jgi:hypothetical protein
MTRTGQKIHPNPAPELLCRASEIDARFQETQVAIKTTEVIKMTAKGRFATILIALTVFGCKGALQTSAAKAAEGLSSASAGDPAEHECAVDGGVGLGGLCTGPENGGGPEHWDKLPDKRPERESERRIAGELDQADGGAWGRYAVRPGKWHGRGRSHAAQQDGMLNPVEIGTSKRESVTELGGIS